MGLVLDLLDLSSLRRD